MTAGIPAFPRKLFYKINEVADIVGVEPYVLRYWETKFPMLKPERYGNDERRYRAKDIELLLRMRSLLYEEKFTIAGAVERIRKDPAGILDSELPRPQASDVPEEQLHEQLEFLASETPSPGPMPLHELRGRLASIRAELHELNTFLAD